MGIIANQGKEDRPLASFDKADMVLKNGKIVTLNPKDEIVEAVAVKDGIIRRYGACQRVRGLH